VPVAPPAEPAAALVALPALPAVAVPAVPPAAAAAPAAAQAPARRCENCGSPLYGEHCFQCGQPTKGLVRHFSSILGDFFDTVLNIDSRVIRTIGPLLVRPGYLSLEYFSGRRVRYVTPMRLFLFMSLVAFFAVQLAVDFNDDSDGRRGDGGIHIGADAKEDSFDKAQTIAEVEKARDELVADLRKQRNEIPDVPGARVGMDVAISQIEAKAERRITELRGQAKSGKPAAKEERGYRDFNLRIFNDKPWHPETNPLAIAWLPDAVNHSLNRRIKRAVDVAKSDDGQASIGRAFFNVLPQTLLVLMPIFALMLKIAYLFKRRLYMEHLIVALHSHAFIAAAVTVMVLLSWLEGMLAEGTFLHGLLAWAFGLAIAWVPVYLLVMQKRIYGQGWPMTIAKYAVLGMCYSVLLGFALAGAVIVGFLTL
jgi:hypothetical protein